MEYASPGMGIWGVVGDVLLAVLFGLMVMGLVVLVLLEVRRTPRRRGRRGPEDARDVLRRRYLGGEIDGHEFWHRMSGITGE
jgi:uncharacterized membrane protein